MKTLIFTLIFSHQAFAATTTPPEITDPQITRQLVSVAQDIKNEQVIAGVPDLQKCQQDYQQAQKSQSAPASGAADPALQALERCVKDKINSAGPQQAGTLSDKLNLETYKLIPSKTVQNVTTYLTEKLYQSLTGVDLKERDVARKIQAMKFNTKKQINHKDFYELYKNQIAKNALYEVSRFCLVDFRRNPEIGGAATGTSTFAEHWGDLSDFASDNIQFQNVGFSDDGDPKFEQSNSTSSADSTQSYRDIMKNVFNTGSTTIDPDKLSRFFFYCGKKINELCENFEKKCTTGTNCTGASQQAQTPPAGGQTPAVTLTGGQKACLAKTRLTAFKRAMKASEDIVKGFEENVGADIFLKLDKDMMVKRYQGGQGDEKSINELTNNASAEFFKATKNESMSEAQDCVDDPANCDQFVVESDAETRIEQNTQLVYLAKREAELARVKELVKTGGQPLDEYLEKNYPDLKDKPRAQLENLISQRWDARRIAIIDEIKNKIGTRQVTEQEASKASTQGLANLKEDVARDNAKAAISEKTRLAQVVFFNNIISSSLKLKDSNQNELGRNVQALDNEFDGADSEAKGVFTNLRSQLRGSTSGSSGGGQLTGNESVTNIEFLDEFIGVPKDQTGNSRSTAGRPQ